MKQPAGLFSIKCNGDSIIAALAGASIIWLFTRHSGLGISPDAVSYLSAARDLRAGAGLMQFDQLPLVDFPGLYPIFLAGCSLLTGHDPLAFGPLINSVLFAVLIYSAGALMNGFSTRQKIYKIILLSCLVLSPCLLEVYPMLWSETLFLIWVVFFILAMTRYLQTHRQQTLWIAAGVTALACITRYAGVSIIGTGLMLIILDRKIMARQKFFNALIYLTGSCCLLLTNLIRNRMVMGYSTGVRQRGITPLMDNVRYCGDVFCEWLPLPKYIPWLSTLVGLAALIYLVVLAILFTLDRRRFHSFEKVAAAFSLVYLLFILASATLSRYQQLNSRLLSPVFIPFLWSLSFWLPPLIRRSLRWKKWVAVIAGIGFFAAFQYNQWQADYETYDGVKDAGVPGYTEDPVPQYKLVQYLESHDSLFMQGYPVYSNAADAVYFFTRHPARFLPQQAFPQRVKQFYGLPHYYLIWFNDPDIDNPDEVSLTTILQHVRATPVAQFDEGAIYRIDQ